MPNYYLEPTISPRGQEVTQLEAKRRAQANARLNRYKVPVRFDNMVQHRQRMAQGKSAPVGPYTSPVQEGLLGMIGEEGDQ